MMERFVEDWRRYGVDAWNEVPNHWLPDSNERVGWWSLPAYLGDRFIAPLLGAPAGTCIMQPNVHWTMQCLLSSREVFAGNRNVVLTEGAFPSVRFTVKQWADAYGYEIREVPLKAHRIDTSRLAEAIDPDTALVVISHVGFLTGEKLTDDTIRNLAARSHEAGALLAVDGYHAIGSSTNSVGDMDVDVYFGGLLKEGCGSSGNAFLYIRPGLELTPRTTGWFGDGAPFLFKDDPIPHNEIRRRFLGGTTAVASLYHAVEGVRLLLNAGLDSVRADSLEKTNRAIEHADRIDLPLHSPREPEARSAMLIFEIERADLLTAWLKKRRILVDSRQSRYLRMAPFVWNTLPEIDKTFDALSEALAGREYLSVELENTAGPVT